MIDLNLARELMTASEHFQYNSAPAPITIEGDFVPLPFNKGSLSTSEFQRHTAKTVLGDTEVFVSHNGLGDVVVVFRGSEWPFGSLTFSDPNDNNTGGIKDWFLTNFHSNRIGYPPAPGYWPDTRWVHSGFWHAYNDVAAVLFTFIRQQMLWHPVKNIYVTGHSLGGAVGYLAALDLSWRFIGFPVHLYSFASPRVGDVQLNHLLRASLADCYFVILSDDPVPHLPPLGPNFPLTFKSIRIDFGAFTTGVGNPLPSLFQNYDTGKELVYINYDLTIDDKLPVGELAFNFDRHLPEHYTAVISAIGPHVVVPPKPTSQTTTTTNLPPLIHSAMQP